MWYGLRRWLIVIALITASHAAHAACSVTNMFTSGTIAVSSAVNENFSELVSCWSGGVLTNGTLAGNTTLPGPGVITSSGNIGIGTASPDAKLTLQNTGTGSAGLWEVLRNSSGADKWTLNELNAGDLNFAESGVADGRLYLKAGGYVGIGTTSPDAKLTLQNDGTGGNGLWEVFRNSSGADKWTLSELSAGDLNFAESGVADGRLYLKAGGYVGIGNTSPNSLLHVGSPSVSGSVVEMQNSSGACTFTPTSGGLTPSCTSDIRLKKDIIDTGDQLPWLRDMRIRDFTIRATGERSTGVIAQELQDIRPDMIHIGPDGYFTVDAPNPWKLVRVLQQQQAEIAELKNIVGQLNAANDRILKQIEKMGLLIDAKADRQASR